MSVSYNEAGNYILVVLEGPFDGSAIEGIRTDVIFLVKKYHCFRIIADITRANNELSVTDIFWQTDATAKKMGEEGVQYPSFKRAIIVEKGNSKAEFFEMVANNRGQQVKLFESLEEAELWLN